MSDDKIIDFNELKEKVKESDINKFEQYVQDLYMQINTGQMTMFQFSKKMSEYMQENNISEEKLVNIQMKMMERYGIDPKMLEDEMKKMGMDPNQMNFSKSDEDKYKSEKSINDFDIDELVNNDKGAIKLGFFEKYKSQLEEKTILEYRIQNDKNDIKILMNGNELVVISEKKLDLSDDTINKFIANYRSTIDTPLKVIICEATNTYEYK
ncbi:DUF3867 family protein [Peptostreptococcus equinus]|uniref:DUF3867 family protein n=1 Tax=Peptostreptococcus equinus TaxID=3003601 RepID=A0ABY7JTC0_9FIRM|nr:DUF3867 family protein [Peptostreptococcus sp. CBA3647]WAW15167.1 DUF3867 family protein [Peptostreptococcus sp. CBA3647]